MMKLVKTTASQTGRAFEVEPLLLEVADVVNTTLDLETTLRPYRIHIVARCGSVARISLFDEIGEPSKREHTGLLL